MARFTQTLKDTSCNPLCIRVDSPGTPNSLVLLKLLLSFLKRFYFSEILLTYKVVLAA